MSKKSSKRPPQEPAPPSQPTSKSGAHDDPPSVTAQGQNQLGIGSIGGQGHTIHVTILQSPPRVGSSVSDSALLPDAGGARMPAESPAPPAAQREVLRIELVDRLWDRLEAQRRLLILSPRRGGARTLVRQMLSRSRFPEGDITRLSPSTLATDAGPYFAVLCGDPRVTSALDYHIWQQARLRPGSRRHLIVLLHDGGDPTRLHELAEALRACQQDEHFLILVAGEARTAALKYGVVDNSYFSGMPEALVPDLRSEEIQALLGCDPATAQRIAQATGGHPGLVRTVGRLGLDALPHEPAALDQALSRTPDVLGILKRRMDDDDRQKRSPRRHAASVLRTLLDGKPVKSLPDLGSDPHFPEVRLFYDGLLRCDEEGRTLLRCEAVRRAAALVLSQWEEGQE